MISFLKRPTEHPAISIRGRIPETPRPRPSEIGQRDFQHFLLKRILKGNYLAPVPENAASIIDVGAGSGYWAREMARAFPQAQVIGIDQAASAQLSQPGNYLFEQANVIKGLPYGHESFDFVHMRAMGLAIPAFHWSRVLRELARVSRPGGWIELVEASMTIFPAGEITRSWMDQIKKATEIFGIDLELTIPRLPAMLKEAGLRVVRMFHVDIPLGAWAGRLGIMGEANMRAIWRQLQPRHSAAEPEQQAEDIWTRLIVEWNNRQSKQRFLVVCGQK